MEISKLPPPPDRARSAPAALGDRPAQAAVAAASPLDHAGIKPLDLVSAVKILLTEVQLAMIESQHAMAGLLPAPPADVNELLAQVAARLALVPAEAPPVAEACAPVAARALVDLLLHFLPAADATTVEPFNETVANLTAAFDSASRVAVDRVSAWRGTPPAVVDTLVQARGLALALISEEPPVAVLARPEWLGLAPRLAQLRRRRRRRLLLTDVDADHVDTDVIPRTDD